MKNAAGKSALLSVSAFLGYFRCELSVGECVIWDSVKSGQTYYQRQDKIQIHRQEIIHHYKNMRIPLC